MDGGVAMETVADVVRAGAEILVAGNAVFGKGDPKAERGSVAGRGAQRELAEGVWKSTTETDES